MRLRNWIAVVVSVILLIAVGTIGVLVNRSTLRAADQVHRADTRTLAVNNATLAGRLQLLSAAELNDFRLAHTLHLGRGSVADRDALIAFADKSSYFRYGVVITDLTGQVLNATRTTGLPAPNDVGYTPMRDLLLQGKPGFSSIMMVGRVALEAVAVPITVSGSPVAILVGYNNVAETQLQNYCATIGAQAYVTTIVDSTGRVAASSRSSRLGTVVEQALIGGLADGSPHFVEYDSDGTAMIAVMVGDMPGGWAYMHTQTLASFDGAVHARSQTLTLTLLAMLLIGVVGISLLGYRTQVQRRRADERFQALFQHAPDLVSVLDATGRIAYASPSAAAILGITGSLTGANVFDLVHPDDRLVTERQFEALNAEHDGVLRLQCRVRDGRGEYRWFDMTASNQRHNPALEGIVVNARDVSENRAFQERLRHEAEHDALTGLPNRRRMRDQLASTLRQDPVAVLFVDLDGFKPVNDVHGHEAGDDLLRQVATRLSTCVREGDVLSRIGGDEFVVLMPGVFTPTEAEAMSHRIQAALLAPFPVGGQDLTIGASVGVHVASTRDHPDQALRAADHAMYAVKHHRGADPSARPGRHRTDA